MTIPDPNVVHRCAWAETDSLLRSYHDEEWGLPEHDGRKLWEKLMLDGFQAGLSCDHDTPEARRLPEGVQELRPGKGRGLS